MALGLLAAGVLVVDQVTKAWALSALTPGVYVPVLGDVFGLTLVFNPGAAFSLATGSTWIFTVVAVVVAVATVRLASRLGSRGWALALGGLLGGNLGNLGDRLFREPGFARGHVVDFLNYNSWFVGNVADIAIVLAAGTMAVLAFLGIGVDGTRHAGSDRAERPAAREGDDSSDGDGPDDHGPDDHGRDDGAPDDGARGQRHHDRSADAGPHPGAGDDAEPSSSRAG